MRLRGGMILHTQGADVIPAWNDKASAWSWWNSSSAAEHQRPRAGCRFTALAVGHHEHSIIHGMLWAMCGAHGSL